MTSVVTIRGPLSGCPETQARGAVTAAEKQGVEARSKPVWNSKSSQLPGPSAARCILVDVLVYGAGLDRRAEYIAEGDKSHELVSQ